MFEINRILLQLHNAVKLAISPHPQERSISIILFDNLIETSLYKRTDYAFMVDRSDYYHQTRQFDKKERYHALSQYDGLLKFSKDLKFITEKEFDLLKFAHNIRNKIYHTGEASDGRTQIVLLIFHQLLFNKPPFIRSSWGTAFTESPGYDKIDFGQKPQIAKPGDPDYLDSFFKSDEYYDEAYHYIMSQFTITATLTELVRTYLTDQINHIEYALKEIEKNIKTINFYEVIYRYWHLNSFFEFYAKAKRKPKSVESVLLIFMFLRLNKEDLFDIPNLKERTRTGNRLYLLFRGIHKGKYPDYPDLRRLKLRLQNLPKNDEHKIIKTLIEIQLKIAPIYSDSYECASEMEGYIQELFDSYRGK